MKGRSVSEEEIPERQELLQDPGSSPPIRTDRLIQVIPSQLTISEKSKRAGPPEQEEFDVVSAAIGEYGRWQLLMTFLLALFSFPCTFHIYLPTFTATETKFWCRRPENLRNVSVEKWMNYSQPKDACSILDMDWSQMTFNDIMNGTAPITNALVRCESWEFDKSDVGETIISEWGLVCDRSGLRNIAEVVFLIGVGVGGVLGGMVSDKFGRKNILMTMLLAQTILGLAQVLVQTYVQYVIVRIVMGLVSVSVVYAAFVLSVELVGGKWVTIAGTCNFFPLPMSYVIVSAMSLVLPDWRNLQLALSLPGCLLLALWFIIPESPRWLLSTGRTKEVKAILQKAAKFNGRELPQDLDKLLQVNKQGLSENEPSAILLFKKPLMKRTILLFFVWFAMTIGYYGLLLNIGNFNLGNLHYTSMILGAVEIPAIAMCIPLLLKAGRRIPIFVTMLVCGVACVASEVFNLAFNEQWITIICLMIGKFAIGSTNIMLPIYTAELYPTVIRNLGVGCSQISAGCGLICIPYLWTLATLLVQLPMVTIATLCAFGGAVVLFLPDTGKTEKQEVSDTKKPSLESSASCNGTFSAADRGN